MTPSDPERGAVGARRSPPLSIVEGMAGCHCACDLDMDVGGEIDADGRWVRRNRPRRESVLGAKLGVKLGAKLGAWLGVRLAMLGARLGAGD